MESGGEDITMGPWCLPNKALHLIFPYLKDTQEHPYKYEIPLSLIHLVPTLYPRVWMLNDVQLDQTRKTRQKRRAPAIRARWDAHDWTHQMSPLKVDRPWLKSRSHQSPMHHANHRQDLLGCRSFGAVICEEMRDFRELFWVGGMSLYLNECLVLRP